MFSLIRSLPTRKLVLEQVPAIGISLLIAEMFYKFHSFTLECSAFLITWYAFDFALHYFSSRRVAPSGTS